MTDVTDTEGKHIGKITLDVAEGPIAVELMNPLHTKGDCETRWGSFMECIKRFKALRPYILSGCILYLKRCVHIY